MFLDKDNILLIRILFEAISRYSDCRGSSSNPFDIPLL